MTKDEITELLIDAVKSNKAAQSIVSIKLQGENGIIQFLEDCKQSIYKEFYPTRGFPKLKVAAVKQTISDMNNVGKGTIWPFELRVYFCEIAVKYIHEDGDIFESMGDFFTDAYDKVIQALNKEKASDLFEKYKDRIIAIVNTSGCDCWGML